MAGDGDEGGGSPTRFSEHLEHTFNPLVRAISELQKPVIAAVNGVAAGAGASLALICDIRLWSSAASAIQVFSNIGLIPDSGATWMLPRLVGYQRAFELMAFAEKVTAEQALSLGLCEHVYPAAEFAAQVEAYAQRLAARPLTALTLTKQALRRSLSGTLDQALRTEAELQGPGGPELGAPRGREGVSGEARGGLPAVEPLEGGGSGRWGVEGGYSTSDAFSARFFPAPFCCG